MPTRGALQDWYEKAGVRKDPRRTVDIGVDEARELFPPRLIPPLQHEYLREISERTRREISARHLFQYLMFTANFETRVVNRATERIASGRCDLNLDDGMRIDAYKIYCDEAYHALYSFDIVHQMASATGVAPVGHDFDGFLRSLDAIGEQEMPEEPVLAELLQVIVFETLVTAILNEVPKDTSVLPVVREIVRDHAIDEGRHHAFFSGFFRELWANLDSRQRNKVARCLPRLIVRSLRPDLEPIKEILSRSGFGEKKVIEIIDGAYPESSIREKIRETSRHSVKLFQEVGVLDVPGGDDAFREEGLLQESSGNHGERTNA